MLERVGPVAYKMGLPLHIKVHDVFHVSLLKKKLQDASHSIDLNVIHVGPEEEFLPELLQILEREEIE